MKCAACDLGTPEYCTGFVGTPVDGPQGQHVEECEQTPDIHLRRALYHTRIRLQMHLEAFPVHPSALLSGVINLVCDALEGQEFWPDGTPMSPDSRARLGRFG